MLFIEKKIGDWAIIIGKYPPKKTVIVKLLSLLRTPTYDSYRYVSVIYAAHVLVLLMHVEREFLEKVKIWNKELVDAWIWPL